MSHSYEIPSAANSSRAVAGRRRPDGDIAPTVTEAERPDYVVWSSQFNERLDARVRFERTVAHGGPYLL